MPANVDDAYFRRQKLNNKKKTSEEIFEQKTEVSTCRDCFIPNQST